MECVSFIKWFNFCYLFSLNCEVIDDFKFVNFLNVIGIIIYDEMVLIYKIYEGFFLLIFIYVLVI